MPNGPGVSQLKMHGSKNVFAVYYIVTLISTYFQRNSNLP